VKKWLFLVVLLIGASFAIGERAWRQSRSEQYESLDAILTRHEYSGMTLVQAPDEPGPYQHISTVVGHMDSPISGAFSVNGRSRKFSVAAEKGSYFEVVGLAPAAGGEPTFAVLCGHQTDP
jgi:hypothetical protein